MILPIWFHHLVESFSHKEVQLKIVLAAVKTSCPPAKSVIETAESITSNKKIQCCKHKPSLLLQFLVFVSMVVVFDTLTFLLFSMSTTHCTPSVLINKIKIWSVLICQK